MKMFVSLWGILLFADVLSAQNYRNYSDDNDQNAPVQTESEVTVKMFDHPKLGKILTDSKGMTLYMFTPDSDNESTCYGQCEVQWPPLVITSGKPTLAPGTRGTLDITKRRDNTSQVTFNGMPLYYYFKDKKPGDVTGQNVDNKWFVVNPDKREY